MGTKTELPRIIAEDPLTNPIDGVVKWSPVNSIWLTLHATIAVVGGALTISLSAIAVFIATTAVTLCLGHSLGMHRKLIHDSFACPKWLEYFLVHCGVLVGMAGPFGMVRTHDLRDWAQRQPECHPYLRHGSHPLRDAWWQLHCELRLTHPPRFAPGAALSTSRTYRFMQRTWMLQQLPLGLLLFSLGGLPWVVWGISARVTVSVIGHWLVGYLAHNRGHVDNEVVGAAVQGHNVKWASYLTMGESWHNNHHAYPGSALLGLYDDQADPGWWVLNALLNVGLVWNIVLPEDLPTRKNLRALTPRARQGAGTKGPSACPVLGLLR
jgi:fatty-acid desaturase